MWTETQTQQTRQVSKTQKKLVQYSQHGVSSAMVPVAMPAQNSAKYMPLLREASCFKACSSEAFRILKHTNCRKLVSDELFMPGLGSVKHPSSSDNTFSFLLGFPPFQAVSAFWILLVSGETLLPSEVSSVWQESSEAALFWADLATSLTLDLPLPFPCLPRPRPLARPRFLGRDSDNSANHHAKDWGLKKICSRQDNLGI